MSKAKALEYFNRGKQKAIQEDFHGAIEDFTYAIEEDPSFTDAYIERADAKRGTRDIATMFEAFTDYNEVLEIEPNNAKALMDKGTLMCGFNPENPDGLLLQQKAAEIDPNMRSYWNIGIAQLQREDFEGALKSFQRYIQSEHPTGSELGEAYYFVGLSYARLNQYENAIDSLTQAIINKAGINYFPALYNRAFAYATIGELNAAIKDYDKVIELSPEDAYAYFYRGKCHFVLKDGLACKDWTIALQKGCKEAKDLIDEHCKPVSSEMYGLRFKQIDDI